MAQPVSKSKSRIRTEIVKTIVSLFAIGVGLAGFVVLFMLREPPPDKETDSLIPLVSIVEAKRHSGKLDLLVSGSVQPAHEFQLMAEVAGRVIERSDDCEAGSFVSRGTVLFKIDPTDYELACRTAEADLEQAKRMETETANDLAGIKVSVENAVREVELLEKDFESKKGLQARNALSQTELDQAERTLLSSKSQLSTLRKSVESTTARLARMTSGIDAAQARLEQAKQNCRKTVVRAPETGVIVEEMIQRGEFVRAGDRLVTFETTGQVEVLCTLTAGDLEWLRKHKQPTTKTDAPLMIYWGMMLISRDQASSIFQVPETHVEVFESKSPEIKWSGRLVRVDGIGFDEQTKTVPCRIIVDKPIVKTEFGLRALGRNAFVKCKIEIDANESTVVEPVVFPATALRPGGYVWVAEKGDILGRRDVQVVDYFTDEKTDEQMVVVESGKNTVKPGEHIITSPLNQATVGATIIVDNPLTDDDSGNDKKMEMQAGSENDNKSDSDSSSESENEES